MLGTMTVTELIEELGGTVAVARRLDVLPSRISNWKADGRFPDSLTLHERLSEICVERGLALDPALFGRRETAA